MFTEGLANYRKPKEGKTKAKNIRGQNISKNEYFIGRKEIVEEIHSVLLKDNVVVLRGIGGLGKTLIANAYAGEYDKKYPELVQEIINFCNKSEIDLYNFNKSTPKECLINLLNFLKKEERLPFYKEIKLYSTLRKLRKNGYKNYPKLVKEIKDLCNKLNLPLNIKED